MPSLAPSIRYVEAPNEAVTGRGRAVEVRWIAILAEPSGPAVSQAAAVILAERGEPFRARSRLPIGSRWLRGPELDAALRDPSHRAPNQDALPAALASARAVLTPGLVTLVQPATPPLPQLRLEPAADQAGPVRVLVEIDDDGRGGREVLLIEDGLPNVGAAALFVPTEALAPGGLLVVLEARGDAEPSRVQAAAAAAAAATAAAPSAPPSPRAQAWQLAGAAVGERNRRPALLALVAPLQLQRSTDMLLVADEAALAAVTPPMTATDADGPDVRWELERGLWRALMPRMQRDALTPAMRAAAARHLGAAASDTASLDLLLDTCTDEPAFTQALLRANVRALDDHSAADRAAALRFLAARGHAPADYDPMMEPTKRRRLVRRALARLEREEQR
jgi:hypothetical protein